MAIHNHRVLLDSNILIYAINETSPKHHQALAYLESFAINDLRPVVAQQNIVESIRVLTHSIYQNPITPKQAQKELNKIQEICFTIHPFSETLDITLSLISKYNLRSNHIFDAYLAATMLSNSVRAIATDNIKNFKVFEEIRVINPFI